MLLLLTEVLSSYEICGGTTAYFSEFSDGTTKIIEIYMFFQLQQVCCSHHHLQIKGNGSQFMLKNLVVGCISKANQSKIIYLRNYANKQQALLVVVVL